MNMHHVLITLLLAAALLFMVVGAFMACRAARQLHQLDEGPEIHSHIEFANALAEQAFGVILFVVGLAGFVWWCFL